MALSSRSRCHRSSLLPAVSFWRVGFEPWALVVHEAASAGRLILASENVGAVPHLVQPGYNGYIFDNERWRDLQLHGSGSAMTDVQLDQMSHG